LTLFLLRGGLGGEVLKIIIMDSTKILNFLRTLTTNNDREWFHAHKALYDEARGDFENFVNKIIPEIYKFDQSIGLITAKDCLFRIFRDIRFTTDKTPYKTNFGAFIAKNGRRGIQPGYYIHLEDGESLLAGGVYLPSPEVQKTIRKEIYYNVEEFKAIIYDKTFVRLFGQLDEFDKMKKAPKEFPADFKDINLLKYRSLTMVHNMSNAQVEDEGYPDYIVEVFRAMLPLNAFITRAIEG
jgi:uncharacterized protein (TIGR02453 family)